MTQKTIQDLNPDENFPISIFHLEIKHKLKRFLSYSKETKYELNHKVFEGLDNAFFTKSHVLQNLNDKDHFSEFFPFRPLIA